MQSNKPTRRLGRGLDSLINRAILDYQAATNDLQAAMVPKDHQPETERTDSSGPRAAVQSAMLPMESITPNPFQPRQQFNDADVSQLADSIRINGFVQPIIVRSHNKGYQIVAGERRFRAARMLGMTSVPAIIREATDEQMVELALVENIQREDLNPVDRAKAYKAFADRFQLSAEQIAQRLGEDRTTVVNYMRILELQKSVLDLIVARKLSMGHARCLLGVADRDRQLRLAESAARSELSVRALEELVRRERSAVADRAVEAVPVPSSRVRSAHLKDMEQRFEQAVKTRVTIHEGKRRGTGRITIEYYSLHDFERIAHLLGVRLD